MSEELTLAHAQQRMAEALVDRQREALALPLFKGASQLVQQRLAIYRGNLTTTWEKTLAGAYPVIQALVGEEFFSALTREFGKRYPSVDGDLNRYGGDFSEFLVAFPHVAEFPYFADVARVEWAVHQAHSASAPIAFDRRSLAALTPQQLELTHWQLHPACTLLSSEWAVVQIWDAHQPESTTNLPTQIAATEFAVSVRPKWKVALLSLDQAGFLALQHLQRGGMLGEAVDRALSVDPEFDFTAQWQRWLDHSVLVAFN